jgi:hypothetical protein
MTEDEKRKMQAAVRQAEEWLEGKGRNSPEEKKRIVEEKLSIAKESLLIADLDATEKPKAQVEHDAILPQILQGIGRGASFGFSDEISGGIQSMLPYPYGTDYASAVKGVRDRDNQFAEDHPIINTVSEIAGGVMTGIGGSAKLVGTSIANKIIPTWNSLNNLQKGTILGGVGGGVGGAGYAPEGETMLGAAKGTALGGGIGAASVPLTAGAGWLGSHIAKPFKFIADSVRHPNSQAARKLRRAYDRDNIDVEQIPGMIDEMGDGAVIADIGGENVLGLVEGVAKTPGRGKDQILSNLTVRQAAQGPRIEDIISKEISSGVANTGEIRVLESARRQAAKPYYTSAHNTDLPYEVADELIRYGKRPTVKKALKEAMDILEDEGVEDASKIFHVNDAGGVELVSTRSVKAWDYVKRGLDDVIDNGMDPVTGKLSAEAARAVKIKQEILAILDDAVPDYGMARKIFSDSKANESAMQKGRKFFNQDYDVIEDYVGSLSQAEKDFYKMGVARSLQDKIRARVNSGDKTTIFNKEAVWDRLRPVFDDDDSLNRFLQKMEAEQRKSLTYSRAAVGSRTATGQASQRDLLNDVGVSQGGIADQMIGRILKDASNPSEAMTNELAQMLLSNDPAVIQKALAQIAKLKGTSNLPLLPPYLLPGTRAGAGSAIGAGVNINLNRENTP